MADPIKFGGGAANANPPAETYELVIPLSGHRRARIQMPMTSEDFKLLLDTLTLWHGRLTAPAFSATEMPSSNE